MRARAVDDVTKLQELRARRDRARHALSVFRDDPAVIDAVGAAEFAEGLRTRRAELDRAERELAREIANSRSDLPEAAELRHSWAEIDVTTRRRMLRAVFEAVVVKPPTVYRSHSEPLTGRVRFLPSGALTDDLPTPGRNPVRLRPFPPFDDPSGPWIAPTEPRLE